MRILILSILITSFGLSASSQGSTLMLSAKLKPTGGAPGVYIGSIKQVGDKWFLEASHILNNAYAVSGWFTDKELTTRDSIFVWYHVNGNIEKIENYRNNKLEGVFVEYHSSGIIKDSSHYLNGKKIRDGYSWDSKGFLIDSTWFDGNGNGVQVSWYGGAEGGVKAAGFIKYDTCKTNTWNYYFESGNLWAKETYNDTSRVSCKCYDDQGKELDSLSCIKKSDASFPGGTKAWTDYLRKNIDPMVLSDKINDNVKLSVVVAFTINENGELTDIVPETKMGYGTEEQVIKMLEKAPRWIPAYVFGRPVKAYRRQPVTFFVNVR